jgi:hypothetical protein
MHRFWPTAPATASSRAAAWRAPGLAVALAACLPMLAWAQATSTGGIYSCVDASGKRITSDRPIVQCLDREQQERRSDGTVRRVIPPQQTADERAKAEALEKMRAEERARVEDASRRDKTLMQRYPNEAAHRVAREKELSNANDVIGGARKRISELEGERKTLLTEAEFFRKGNMPAALKRKLDENDINMGGALRTISTQQSEIAKINERFDTELARLKRLWAGEVPGFGVASTPTK